MKRITVLIFFMSLFVHADPENISVRSEFQKIPKLNIYEQVGKPNKKLSDLSRIKILAYQKKWNECLSKMPLVAAKNKELEGWIHLVWLDCAKNQTEEIQNKAKLKQAVEAVKNDELFYRGPWKEQLLNSWINVQISLIVAELGKKPFEVERRLESAFHFIDLLNKEQKAQLYELQADHLASQCKNKTQLAAKQTEIIHFYQLSSELSSANTSSAEKLAKLNQQVFVKKTDIATLSKKSEVFPQEVEQDQEIQKSIKQNEYILAEQQMVNYLNNFPNGVFAKKYKEKALENYFSLWEKKNNFADHVFSELMNSDESRLTDWALQLHRRGDYRGALAMAEKVLGKKNQNSVSMLWVAGRCSHFLGQYEKAIYFFDQLARVQTGTEESIEALFRMGLIHYRLGHYPLAVTFFDRLMALSNRDHNELLTRYWLVRSLEKMNSERLNQERDALLEKFPFSYYGLKLRAEMLNGKLEIPTANNFELMKQPAQHWFVGDQKKAWARFKKLLASGWIIEAQAELDNLTMPTTAWSQFNWAEGLAIHSLYLPSILAMNKVSENSSELRQMYLLKEFYPKPYLQLVQSSAQKNNLNPILVFSLIRQESAFYLKARSTSNAMGLMQMIPPTAKEIATKLKMNVEIPDDMHRPEVNIPMGTFYIAQVIEQMSGHVPMGLAAYNAGPTRLRYWLDGRSEFQELLKNSSTEVKDEIWIDELPWGETSFYVKAILRNTLLYQLLDEGRVELKSGFWTNYYTKKAAQ